MGTLTVDGKNIAVDALAAVTTHLGLYGVTAITSVTGTASTNLLNKTSHGLVNGDLVILTSLTGGAGLVAGSASNADGLGRVYWIVGVSGNDFSLALVAGGSAVDFTTDISAVTVNKLTEVAGGSPAYARQAVTYGADASGGVNDIPASETFNVPACTVGAVSGHSALTSGTLYAVDGLIFEPFAAQGQYVLTAASITGSDAA